MKISPTGKGKMDIGGKICKVAQIGGAGNIEHQPEQPSWMDPEAPKQGIEFTLLRLRELVEQLRREYSFLDGPTTAQIFHTLAEQYQTEA